MATLAIVSSVISLVTRALFWNAFVSFIPNKLGAIVVDVATLVGLLWLNWPSRWVPEVQYFRAGSLPAPPARTRTEEEGKMSQIVPDPVHSREAADAQWRRIVTLTGVVSLIQMALVIILIKVLACGTGRAGYRRRQFLLAEPVR